MPVTVPQGRKEPIEIAQDEHPRETTIEQLAKLRPITRKDGSITVGNASGANDGAAGLIIASDAAPRCHGLTPIARNVAGASAEVAPRIMGIGPAPAVRKLLALSGIALDDLSVIELEEAFAAQSLAVTRDLGLDDDDPRVNPNGCAIALGHPPGMTGARIAGTPPLNSGKPAGATASPPCAWASARAQRCSSNASDRRNSR